MWSQFQPQQPPPPGGGGVGPPPLYSGLGGGDGGAPPQESWDSQHSQQSHQSQHTSIGTGYPSSYDEQQGSALTSAVDMVASAASGFFFPSNNKQPPLPQTPLGPPVSSSPYQTPMQAGGSYHYQQQQHSAPHHSQQLPPQAPQQQPPIQPTSSMLSTAPRAPAVHQPPPIQVTSSLLSAAPRRLQPPSQSMGATAGTPNLAGGPPMAFGGPPPAATNFYNSGPTPAFSSSGPPPTSLFSVNGPPPLSIPTPSGGPPAYNTGFAPPVAATPAPPPFAPPMATTPMPALVRPPLVATTTSPPMATPASSPPPMAAPVAAPSPPPSVITKQAPPASPGDTPSSSSTAMKKPMIAISPRSSSTKKLPLPPPSDTLQRRKRGGGTKKFKLPPTFSSTSPRTKLPLPPGSTSSSKTNSPALTPVPAPATSKVDETNEGKKVLDMPSLAPLPTTPAVVSTGASEATATLPTPDSPKQPKTTITTAVEATPKIRNTTSNEGLAVKKEEQKEEELEANLVPPPTTRQILPEGDSQSPAPAPAPFAVATPAPVPFPVAASAPAPFAVAVAEPTPAPAPFPVVASSDDQPPPTEAAAAPESAGSDSVGPTTTAASSAPEVVGDEAPLAPGWQEISDPNTGSIYYWNERDGTTSWDRPVVLLQEEVPTKTLSAVPIPAEDPGRTLTEKSEAAAAAVNEVPVEEAPVEEAPVENDGESQTAEPSTDQPERTMETSGEQLPDGWIELKDESSGSIYYLNTADNTTSWSRPQVDDLAMDTPFKAPPPNSADFTSTVSPEQAPEANEGTVLFKEDLQATEETTETPSFGEVDNALPPGWVEVIDEQSGRPYYFHQADNLTTWDRPGLPSLGTSVATPEEMPETTGEEKEDEHSATPAESEHLACADSSAPEVTQTEQIVNVAAADDDGGGDDGDDDDVALEDTQDTQGDEVAAEAADTTMAILGDLQDERPEGWIECIDPQSGRSYYINERDNITTWERPVAALESDIQNEIGEEIQEEETPEIVGQREAQESTAPEVTDNGEQQPNDLTAATQESSEQNVVEEGSENGLPNGWVELVDPDSGLPYYYNESTQDTRWEKPAVVAEDTTTLEPHVVDDSVIDRPPEELQDETSSYVVVDKGRASREDSTPEVTHDISNGNEPHKPADADVAQSDSRDAVSSTILAPGWKEMFDPNSGKPYYVNEEQTSTVWEKPVIEATSLFDVVAAMPSAEAEVAAAPGTEETAAPGAESSETTNTGDAPESESKPADDLPPGWVEMFDRIGNVTFYYNEAEGKSSWERPTVAQPSVPLKISPAGTVTMDEMVADGRETGADVSEKIKGNTPDMGLEHLDESETPFGAADVGGPSSDEDELPPGWVVVDDPSTGSVFYYNEIENISSFEKPSVTVPDGKQVRSPENQNQSGVGESAADVNTPETEEQQKLRAEEPAEAPVDTETSPTLPPGWTELTDPSSGKTYYVNEEDGTTTWDRPEFSNDTQGELGDEGTEDAEGREKAVEDEQAPATDEAAGEDETVEPLLKAIPHDNDVGDASGDLPAGWIEVFDEASGTSYFVNEAENISTWDRPQQLADVADPRAASNREDLPENDGDPAPEIGDGPTLFEPDQEGQVKTAKEDNGLDTAADSPEIADEATRIASEGEEADEWSIPPGWTEVVDPSSGQIYYAHEDGRASWQRPQMSEQDHISNDIIHTEEVPTPDLKSEEEETGADIPPTEQPVEVEAEGLDSPQEELDTTEAEDARGSAGDPSIQLPPGWVEVADPNTGSTYYYNQMDGNWSWERPKIPDQEALATDADPQVDSHSHDVAGESDANVGAPDHGADADAAVEAKDEILLNQKTELPSGWTQATDESGRTFYVNETDGAVTWDRPTMPDRSEAGPLKGGADNSAVSDSFGQPEAADGELREQVEEPKFEAESQGVFGTATNAEPRSSLPPGWVHVTDPASGTSYYYNESIQESSWELPVWPEPEDVDENEVSNDPLAGTEPNVESVQNDGEGENDLPSKVSAGESTRDEVPEEDGADLAAKTSSEPLEPAAGDVLEEVAPFDLPADWTEIVDPNGRVYFYNQATGLTSWERPSVQQMEEELNSEAVDATIPQAAGETSAEEVEFDGAGLYTENSTPPGEDVQPEIGGGLPEPETAEVSPEPQGETVLGADGQGLPPGWVEAVDQTSGRIYYYNEIDNTSSWDKPSLVEELVSSPDNDYGPAEAETSPYGVAETAGLEEADSQPMPAEAPPGRESEQIWEEVEHQMDLTPGPPEIGRSEEVEPTTEEEFASEAYIQPELPGGTSSQAEHEAADAAGESEGLLEESGLPPGWVAVIDPDSGRTYYVNNSDGTTSWDKPGLPESDVTASREGVINAGASNDYVTADTGLASAPELNDATAVDSTEPESTNELPSGWVEIIDSASGEPYYLNRITNETTWVKPLLDCQEVIASPEPAAVLDELPEGWVEQTDQDGRVFYYNKADHTTSWDRPFAEASPNVESIAPMRESDHNAAVATSPADRRRPGHAFATFGFGGRLCVWRTGNMKLRHVEIHRTRNVAPTHALVLSELAKVQQGISGPLNAGDANSVKSYVEQKTKENPTDLLWQLIQIVSLSRGRIRSQNGATDPDSPEAHVVDLMLRDGIRPSMEVQNGSNGLPGPTPSTEEEAGNKNGDQAKSKMEAIQNFILRGRRADAVEVALESNNFALALLVSTFCDPETYHYAAKQYADKVLRCGSPLHTIVMLFSGQFDPSLWSASSKELLATWRYHLAAIVSNRTQGWERVVFTLGTKLQQLGDTHAAHVCFMVCGIQITSPILPQTSLSLLGCDHLLPDNLSLLSKEGIEAYERTEAYEWAKRRGNPSALIKTLQPFKLQYAILLADLGFVDLAEKYLDNILVMCDLHGDDSRFSVPVTARLTLPEMCESPDGFTAALASFEQRLHRTVPEIDADNKQTYISVQDNRAQQMQPPVPMLATERDTHAEIPIQVQSPLPVDEIQIPGVSAAPSEGDMSFMTATSHFPDASVLDPSMQQPKQKDRISSKLGAGATKIARVKRNAKIEPVVEKPKSQKSLNDRKLRSEGGADSGAPRSGPPAAHTSSAPPSQLTSPPPSKPDLSTPKDIGSSKPSTGSSARKKPEAAPKSAPAVMSQKRDWTFGMKDRMTKWLNPEATTADLGEGMQAYYDEDKKVWVFPGEDPAEKAKPPPPPPTSMPAAEKQEEKPKPNMATDPLAAMMAPPQRTPASFGRSRPGVPGGVPPTPRSLYPGMPPPMPGLAGPGAPGPGSMAAGAAPPQFMVFMPKPGQETKSEEKPNEAAAEE